MFNKLTPVSEEDKKRIRKFFSKGMNAVQIMKKISGYTRQQIAAIMAWETIANKVR
jgi:hypothetical protein